MVSGKPNSEERRQDHPDASILSEVELKSWNNVICSFEGAADIVYAEKWVKLNKYLSYQLLR